MNKTNSPPKVQDLTVYATPGDTISIELSGTDPESNDLSYVIVNHDIPEVYNSPSTKNAWKFMNGTLRYTVYRQSSYELANESIDTSASIYDQSFTKIRTIQLGYLPAGRHSTSVRTIPPSLSGLQLAKLARDPDLHYQNHTKAISWDGKTDDGNTAPPGRYIYEINVNPKPSTGYSKIELGASVRQEIEIIQTEKNNGQSKLSRHLVLGQFSYKSTDGARYSNVVNVLILSKKEINSPPIVDSSKIVVQGTLLPKDLSYTHEPILINVSDPDGDKNLIYKIITPPTRGVISFRSQPYYTAQDHYNSSLALFGAQDEFQFQASDGSALSSITTIKVDIKSPMERESTDNKEASHDKIPPVLRVINKEPIDVKVKEKIRVEVVNEAVKDFIPGEEIDRVSGKIFTISEKDKPNQTAEPNQVENTAFLVFPQKDRDNKLTDVGQILLNLQVTKISNISNYSCYLRYDLSTLEFVDLEYNSILGENGFNIEPQVLDGGLIFGQSNLLKSVDGPSILATMKFKFKSFRSSQFDIEKLKIGDKKGIEIPAKTLNLELDVSSPINLVFKKIEKGIFESEMESGTLKSGVYELVLEPEVWSQHNFKAISSIGLLPPLYENLKVIGEDTSNPEPNTSIQSTQIIKLKDAVFKKIEYIDDGLILKSEYPAGSRLLDRIQLSGSYLLVINTPQNNSLQASELYTWTGTKWAKTAELGHELFPAKLREEVSSNKSFMLGTSGGISNQTVAISGYSRLRGSISERVFLFSESSQGWKFIQVIAGESVFTRNREDFGVHEDSISINGNTLVVGAPKYSDVSNSKLGCVYIYKKLGTKWEKEAQLFPPDTSGVHRGFGRAVDCDGDSILVSSMQYLYVYEYKSGQWSLVTKLSSEIIPPNPNKQAVISWDIDMSEDRISALFTSSNQSAVVTFSKQENEWRETHNFVTEKTSWISISLENNNLLIGDYNANDFNGAVYHLFFKGDQVDLLQKFIPKKQGSKADFIAWGRSVHLSGESLAIRNRQNKIFIHNPESITPELDSQEKIESVKLTGDVNGDGTVNIFDLVIAAGSFGKAGTDIMGDVNGDGGVNIFDLVIVAGNFGKSLAAAPSMISKIELTTQQKSHLVLAIDQLLANPQRSAAEEIVLGVLQAILPERLPASTQLLVNYPNPFNPETWIPFELSQDRAVTISIYDVHGRRIRSLQLGQLTAGRYVTADQAAHWDGKTQEGEAVASGTYFYQLQAGDYTEIRKMIVLK